jgi:mannosyltransferase
VSTALTQERDGVTQAPPAADRAPRWVVAALAALCAVTVALRSLIGLRGGLWRDEAQQLFIVDERSWGAMLDFLRLNESHPPLFYAVLRLWTSLAGGSDAAALALPIALGGALVPALYTVGRRLLSWRVGLLAAALGALSPPLAAHGAMARPYALLPLLTLGATYALIRAVELGGSWRWAGHAAASLALVYTHNWGWLVVGAHWVALAVCLRRGVGRSRAAVLRGWAGAQAALAIGYLPWLPSFVHQSAHAGYSPNNLLDGVDSPAAAPTLILLLIALLSGTLLPWGSNAIAAAAVFWALSVSALAVVASRPEPVDGRHPTVGRTALTVAAVTPLAAMTAAVVLSARSDLLVPHCLAMLAPLLLLLVAAALDRWREAGPRGLAAVAAAALLAGYAAMLPAYLPARSDAREVAATVAAQAAPSDLVVVTPWWLASPFTRYYAGVGERLDFPGLTEVRAVPYDDEIRRLRDPQALAEAQRRVAAAHAAGRRLWFVTRTGAPGCADADCRAKIESSRNYPEVGELRAGQLREAVVRLYGRPVRCETPTQVRARLESLTACLFEVR